MKQTFATGALALSLLASIATSSADPCQQGIWPLDGSTNVPLDEALRIYPDEDLDGLPALGAAIRLEQDGEGIPFTIERHGDDWGDYVELVPDGGLDPDSEYTLRGVDFDALDGSRFTNSGSAELPAAAESTFSTGGSRRVLGYFGFDPTYLVFSEPTAPDDVLTEWFGVEIEETVVLPHVLAIVEPDSKEWEDTADIGDPPLVDGEAAVQFEREPTLEMMEGGPACFWH